MELNYKLEKFEGPLDLLLSLISKNKIDIADIPIALLCDQYMEYINAAEELDMELSSDFLYMASELMVIKSRMLLPRDEENDEDMDLPPVNEEETAEKDAAKKGGNSSTPALDAFGFDLSAITKDMFDIDILWCKERLPDYFTLIHGILTEEEMSDSLWETTGIEFHTGG